MIGRADIEGSKSNVAMNAWLPQASYPCVVGTTKENVRVQYRNRKRSSSDESPGVGLSLNRSQHDAALPSTTLLYRAQHPARNGSRLQTIPSPDIELSQTPSLTVSSNRITREFNGDERCRHVTTLHAWNETPYARRYNRPRTASAQPKPRRSRTRRNRHGLTARKIRGRPERGSGFRPLTTLRWKKASTRPGTGRIRFPSKPDTPRGSSPWRPAADMGTNRRDYSAYIPHLNFQGPQRVSGHRRKCGSTDSRATTVHAKPFSTSVLQGLAGVFATTTKICTDGGSKRAHAQTLLRSPPRTSYSLRHNDIQRRLTCP
ncbi:unnamed protein product [Diatraea saccharalis]|uniref:Uncharacterized protein n=1 Tax=Diatraea saccharalis TaxID=40085 RepID=A0A9N9R661_9NEOP|nr:unnamed protein product [Diatraea saccharalis]